MTTNFMKMVIGTLIKAVVVLKNKITFSKIYYNNIFHKLVKQFDSDDNIIQYVVSEYKNGILWKKVEKMK